MSQNDKETGKSKILSVVPFEHGFHFTTEQGVYTGMTATSLDDFSKKLETIDINSVLFHYPRGDFQKWIDNTIGDKELANRMCFAIEADPTGEKLRKQLLKIVQNRVNELKKALKGH